LTPASSALDAVQQITLHRFEHGSISPAVDEPLEIRVAHGPRDAREETIVSLTMRTPGNDRELAAGFLFTEGIITGRAQIEAITDIGISWLPGETKNAVRVELAPNMELDLGRLQRHFYTSSSCGICGKTSIEAVRTIAPGQSINQSFRTNAEIVGGLPAALVKAQSAFNRTGGLHASALFSAEGQLIALREDVGRHNALDKLIGTSFLAGETPIADAALLVSGRASFELVQKAAMAGIPLIAAVGAPSSLAVELATEFGMTLIGFVRSGRFNIYSEPSRIIAKKS
jgi:FdhD protein